jgi:osmotically-inducible protein OsmY
MRRYQKWVLTLGIMAVTPGIAMAEMPSFLQFGKAKPAASGKAVDGKQDNQAVAERIAAALKAARLKGFDIAIEYQNGIATLTGQVTDLQQRANATKAVSGVPGVRKVENRLVLAKSNKPGIRPVVHESAAASKSPILQAGFDPEQNKSSLQQANFLAGDNKAKAEPVSFAAPAAPSRAQNQAVAQKIGQALGQAGLRGFDIELRYKDGVAGLAGTVSDPAQVQLAERVVSSIPEVKSVDNQLAVRGSVTQPSTAIPAPIMPVSHQMGAPMQQAPMMPAAQPAMPGPPSYGHPGTQASNVVYNNPNLPENAWPAYASYPNSAQVTYPTEYSASAWPYIGPFYPYPQIPLGWRQAQLEWDDGYWNLNFRPRTDKWYWFLSPKNW